MVSKRYIKTLFIGNYCKYKAVDIYKNYINGTVPKKGGPLEGVETNDDIDKELERLITDQKQNGK
jgi:hypothetical protein